MPSRFIEASAAEQIPVFRSSLSAASIDRATRVMESGWLGQGEEVRAFEAALGERLGARNCVAVSSGTAALHLALACLDLAVGAEVVTTPITWIATHHAIHYVGARPVLADIDPTTGNVDPASVAELVSERTGALLAVHYSGYPCDLSELADIADRHGIPLVEDAAQAFGAEYRGAPIGSRDNLQTLSFGPTKNLTTIHGGAVITGDDRQADRLRALRALGQGHGTSERLRREGSSYRSGYVMGEVGYRYDMADVHAAVGLGQLGVVDEENRRRAEIAAAYAHGLAGVEGIEPVRREAERTSSNHFFPALVERRDELAVALRDRGVDTSVHYPLNPLVRAPAGTIPNAEHFARRTLTLPLHASLQNHEMDRVLEAIAAGW